MKKKSPSLPKPNVHFVDPYLLNPYNPVIVNVIGTGGTGSQFLSALARMNQSLIALGHPGLFVQAFDEDIITEANLGRQLFSPADTGMNKAVVLINRLNRFFGTAWKAIPYYYNRDTLADTYDANITISCVDTIAARMDIAAMLRTSPDHNRRSMYWFDLGNSQYTGQVILATVKPVKQPVSKKFKVVSYLPYVTDEYRELLDRSEQEDTTPSCSLAEALQKQDLFINSTLADMGASLLWSMFREGMLQNRGFFLNIKDFRTQPLKIA